MPLKVFMRRAQVLNLYRGMNRAARLVSNLELRKSLCAEIAINFRQNQHLKDSMSLKATLLEAHRQLKQLQAMGAEGSAHETGSWLGESTEDDERGRIGTEWPWQR